MEAFCGAVLRKRQAAGEAWAQLREVRGDGSVAAVSRVAFRADGACEVIEGFAWNVVGRFRGCSEVQWRWEKAGGRWKVWAESDIGETVALSRTFASSSPHFQLASLFVNRFEFSLLPLQPVPSPEPSPAELRVQELSAEVQREGAQEAELQQQFNLLKQQLTKSTQEKTLAVQEKKSLQQKNQDLQYQLDQSRHEFALLTQEKAEATRQQETLQQEHQELQQQLWQSRHDFALLSQQQLEQSRHHFALLMQEKAQATQEKDALQQENQDLQHELETLRHDLISASQKAPMTQQKLQEVTEQLFQLKQHCDDVVAPQLQ